MYCPRCKIETYGEFCENCGTATVETIELESGQREEKKIYNNEIENRKPEGVKFNIKKLISIVVIIIIFGIGITGYNIMKSKYTPRSTVEKYYNYLLNKDYSNAYNMLLNTDNNFLTVDDFKSVMEKDNFENYSIRNYNENEFKNENLNLASNSGTSYMFTVDTKNGLTPIEVKENGKKLLFFDDYKINVDSLVTKWEFTAPKGTKISINGKDPNSIEEPQTSVDNNFIIGSNYSTYTINRIFKGNYDVNATMEGAKKFNITAPAGDKLDIKLEPSEEAIKELQERAKKFLELYYSKSEKSKYNDLLTANNKALEKLDGGGMDYSKVTNKLNELKVTKNEIIDGEHINISVEGTVEYEDSSLVEWGFEKSIGTKKISTDFKFERQDGKWLIQDISYLI